MHRRVRWGDVWAPAAAVLFLLVNALPVLAAAPAEHAIHVGFVLGPGWAAPDGGAAGTRGGAGSVFMGRDWTGPWAWGVDSHFWWHHQDSTSTELTFAGPSLAWHPRPTGPLVRIAAGAAYDHRLLEFAQSSTDLRSDGAGIAVSVAYAFRVGTFVALGPQVDYTRLWLAHGAGSYFWSAAAGATFYFPEHPPAE